MSDRLSRRTLLTGIAATTGTMLAGCGRLDEHAPVASLLDASESFMFHTQRLLLRRQPLVRELSASQISAVFPINGTSLPKGDVYQRLLETGFHDWKLRVHGLVDQPTEWSLSELRALPARSQITMHNCDEGWSAIAQWTGVPLRQVLSRCGVRKEARYVVFHCLDQQSADGNYYYESIDLQDALHPQTILAYDMNGKPLPVGNGAPLRLRVELQIGYKNAKYVNRIELVDRLSSIGKGRGGWWEDFDRAVWYAGQ